LVKGVKLIPMHLLAPVLFLSHMTLLALVRRRLFARFIALGQFCRPLTRSLNLSDHPIQFRPELRLIPEQLFHLPHRCALIFKLHEAI
jgi:hypothetical protein